MSTLQLGDVIAHHTNMNVHWLGSRLVSHPFEQSILSKHFGVYVNIDLTTKQLSQAFSFDTARKQL